MKILYTAAVCCLLAASAGAQGLPDVNKMKQKAAAAAADTGDLAYKAARAAFNKAVKDIPFAYNSSELNLSDPKCTVAGVSVDAFLKNTLIPALVKLAALLPADKQVTVTGHASRRGPDEAAGAFQGNIALSKARAEALVKYLTANSSLGAERFKVVAAGSAQPLPGVDPASDKNCRASIMME
ncbi:MAG TPA: OmpA family protein [Elusimicrobiales bacterium]|nr:OmpA family protein [Elusimicrobiales bacterium]